MKYITLILCAVLVFYLFKVRKLENELLCTSRIILKLEGIPDSEAHLWKWKIGVGHVKEKGPQ